ncbi:MAG: hypothetical protein EXQ53_05780 [Acidobacteria bacterium]|nr:hypothetical protein [Acidobacteriota bacterium]
MKTTAYFQAIRVRPDRAVIRDEWIERAVREPIREHTQTDGRIRRWVRVPEVGDRVLRVILLPNGETVHNAFFDRGFTP